MSIIHRQQQPLSAGDASDNRLMTNNDNTNNDEGDECPSNENPVEQYNNNFASTEKDGKMIYYSEKPTEKQASSNITD